MKQLCSTYSISGSIVTLTGVNVPLSQILLVSDATTGNVLYSMAGPAATGYTQGANSVITLASAPGASDKLTIYFDDGVAVTNGPTSVSVSNLPATQAVSGSVSVSNLPVTQAVSGTISVSNFPATQPVSGTVTAARNWNLAASSDSLTAAVSSLPAVSLAGGQTLTAALANGSTLSSAISNFPAIQNVSLVGDSIAAIPASLTAAVSLASGQNVGVSSLPAVSGNVGITSLPSVTVSNPTTGTPTLGAAVSLASGQNVGISSLPAISVSNFPATQPVSGTVAVSNQPTSISVSNFPATQPVSGTVAVSGTIPVSAASALPVSGAVTSNLPAGSLTMSNSSVGTSSATLLAAGVATKVLAIQNTSSANILYVSTASPATATNGIVLAAGQGYEFAYVPSNALYALGSAAGTTYTIWLA